MSWVKEALSGLERGEQVKIRPHGSSMRGCIESGQLVTLFPADFAAVKENDVVFIKWKGNYLLHLVKDKNDSEILVGNNLGKTNGWAPGSSVLVKVVKVED